MLHAATAIRFTLTLFWDDTDPKNKGWAYDLRTEIRRDDVWESEDGESGPVDCTRRVTGLDTLRRRFFRGTTASTPLGRARRAFAQSCEWRALQDSHGYKARVEVAA